MRARILAVATILLGAVILAMPSRAAAEAPEPINKWSKIYHCQADTDGDGAADLRCWGMNGCQVSSRGCTGW